MVPPPLPPDGALGTELLAVATSVILLALYRWWLRRRLRGDPLYTIQAYHRHVRARWVERMMADPAQAILVVQTLRNSTMAATFMASTIVLLLMGSLGLANRPEAIGLFWPALQDVVPAHPEAWGLKVLALVVDLFVAFFAFAMSVRLYAHLGYQIVLPADDVPGGVSAKRVLGMLNRAGALFSLGLRACYLAMPLVFWLFGPAFLVVATAVLVVVMALLDRARVPEAD